ncbi:MAG: methyltransferase domain-containing protein, partial [Candidatus Omnitrophica bacterium]|nr:methyltransferase domain-containing protein [Candidatus Omnitrophota bacterium]
SWDQPIGEKTFTDLEAMLDDEVDEDAKNEKTNVPVRLIKEFLSLGGVSSHYGVRRGLQNMEARQLASVRKQEAKRYLDIRKNLSEKDAERVRQAKEAARLLDKDPSTVQAAVTQTEVDQDIQRHGFVTKIGVIHDDEKGTRLAGETEFGIESKDDFAELRSVLALPLDKLVKLREAEEKNQKPDQEFLKLIRFLELFRKEQKETFAHLQESMKIGIYRPRDSYGIERGTHALRFEIPIPAKQGARMVAKHKARRSTKGYDKLSDQEKDDLAAEELRKIYERMGESLEKLHRAEQEAQAEPDGIDGPQDLPATARPVRIEAEEPEEEDQEDVDPVKSAETVSAESISIAAQQTVAGDIRSAFDQPAEVVVTPEQEERLAGLDPIPADMTPMQVQEAALEELVRVFGVTLEPQIRAHMHERKQKTRLKESETKDAKAQAEAEAAARAGRLFRYYVYEASYEKTSVQKGNAAYFLDPAGVSFTGNWMWVANRNPEEDAQMGTTLRGFQVYEYKEESAAKDEEGGVYQPLFNITAPSIQQIVPNAAAILGDPSGKAVVYIAVAGEKGFVIYQIPPEQSKNNMSYKEVKPLVANMATDVRLAGSHFLMAHRDTQTITAYGTDAISKHILANVGEVERLAVTRNPENDDPKEWLVYYSVKNESVLKSIIYHEEKGFRIETKRNVADLEYPIVGMDVDGDGNIMVLRSPKAPTTFIMVSPNGETIPIRDTKRESDEEPLLYLYEPSYLRIGPDGNLYVSDQGRTRRYTTSQARVTTAVEGSKKVMAFRPGNVEDYKTSRKQFGGGGAGGKSGVSPSRQDHLEIFRMVRKALEGVSVSAESSKKSGQETSLASQLQKKSIRQQSKEFLAKRRELVSYLRFLEKLFGMNFQRIRQQINQLKAEYGEELQVIAELLAQKQNRQTPYTHAELLRIRKMLLAVSKLRRQLDLVARQMTHAVELYQDAHRAKPMAQDFAQTVQQIVATQIASFLNELYSSPASGSGNIDDWAGKLHTALDQMAEAIFNSENAAPQDGSPALEGQGPDKGEPTIPGSETGNPLAGSALSADALLPRPVIGRTMDKIHAEFQQWFTYLRDNPPKNYLMPSWQPGSGPGSRAFFGHFDRLEDKYDVYRISLEGEKPVSHNILTYAEFWTSADSGFYKFYLEAITKTHYKVLKNEVFDIRIRKENGVITYYVLVPNRIYYQEIPANGQQSSLDVAFGDSTSVPQRIVFVSETMANAEPDKYDMFDRLDALATTPAAESEEELAARFKQLSQDEQLQVLRNTFEDYLDYEKREESTFVQKGIDPTEQYSAERNRVNFQQTSNGFVLSTDKDIDPNLARTSHYSLPFGSIQDIWLGKADDGQPVAAIRFQSQGKSKIIIFKSQGLPKFPMLDQWEEVKKLFNLKPVDLPKPEMEMSFKDLTPNKKLQILERVTSEYLDYKKTAEHTFIQRGVDEGVEESHNRYKIMFLDNPYVILHMPDVSSSIIFTSKPLNEIEELWQGMAENGQRIMTLGFEDQGKKKVMIIYQRGENEILDVADSNAWKVIQQKFNLRLVDLGKPIPSEEFLKTLTLNEQLQMIERLIVEYLDYERKEERRFVQKGVEPTAQYSVERNTIGFIVNANDYELVSRGDVAPMTSSKKAPMYRFVSSWFQDIWWGTDSEGMRVIAIRFQVSSNQNSKVVLFKSRGPFQEQDILSPGEWEKIKQEFNLQPVDLEKPVPISAVDERELLTDVQAIEDYLHKRKDLTPVPKATMPPGSSIQQNWALSGRSGDTLRTWLRHPDGDADSFRIVLHRIVEPDKSKQEIASSYELKIFINVTTKAIAWQLDHIYKLQGEDKAKRDTVSKPANSPITDFGGLRAPPADRPMNFHFLFNSLPDRLLTALEGRNLALDQWRNKATDAPAQIEIVSTASPSAAVSEFVPKVMIFTNPEDIVQQLRASGFVTRPVNPDTYILDYLPVNERGSERKLTQFFLKTESVAGVTELRLLMFKARDEDQASGNAEGNLWPNLKQARKVGDTIYMLVEVLDQEIERLIGRTGEVRYQNETVKWNIVTVAEAESREGYIKYHNVFEYEPYFDEAIVEFARRNLQPQTVDFLRQYSAEIRKGFEKPILQIAPLDTNKPFIEFMHVNDTDSPLSDFDRGTFSIYPSGSDFTKAFYPSAGGDTLHIRIKYPNDAGFVLAIVNINNITGVFWDGFIFHFRLSGNEYESLSKRLEQNNLPMNGFPSLWLNPDMQNGEAINNEVRFWKESDTNWPGPAAPKLTGPSVKPEDVITPIAQLAAAFGLKTPDWVINPKPGGRTGGSEMRSEMRIEDVKSEMTTEELAQEFTDAGLIGRGFGREGFEALYFSDEIKEPGVPKAAIYGVTFLALGKIHRFQFVQDWRTEPARTEVYHILINNDLGTRSVERFSYTGRVIKDVVPDSKDPEKGPVTIKVAEVFQKYFVEAGIAETGALYDLSSRVSGHIYQLEYELESTDVSLAAPVSPTGPADWSGWITRGEYIDIERGVELKARAAAQKGQDVYFKFTNGLAEYEQILGVPEGSIRAELEAVVRQEGSVNVLDVGPGKGNFLKDIKNIPGVKAAGQSLVRFDDPADKLDIFEGDMLHLDFADQSQDFVYCVFNMAHSGDPYGVISEIFRVLKVGGVAKITFDYPTNYKMLDAFGEERILSFREELGLTLPEDKNRNFEAIVSSPGDYGTMGPEETDDAKRQEAKERHPILTLRRVDPGPLDFGFKINAVRKDERRHGIEVLYMGADQSIEQPVPSALTPEVVHLLGIPVLHQGPLSPSQVEFIKKYKQMFEDAGLKEVSKTGMGFQFEAVIDSPYGKSEVMVVLGRDRYQLIWKRRRDKGPIAVITFVDGKTTLDFKFGKTGQTSHVPVHVEYQGEVLAGALFRPKVTRFYFLQTDFDLQKVFNDFVGKIYVEGILNAEKTGKSLATGKATLTLNEILSPKDSQKAHSRVHFYSKEPGPLVPGAASGNQLPAALSAGPLRAYSLAEIFDQLAASPGFEIKDRGSHLESADMPDDAFFGEEWSVDLDNMSGKGVTFGMSSGLRGRHLVTGEKDIIDGGQRFLLSAGFEGNYFYLGSDYASNELIKIFPSEGWLMQVKADFSNRRFDVLVDGDKIPAEEKIKLPANKTLVRRRLRNARSLKEEDNDYDVWIVRYVLKSEAEKDRSKYPMFDTVLPADSAAAAPPVQPPSGSLAGTPMRRLKTISEIMQHMNALVGQTHYNHIAFGLNQNGDDYFFRAGADKPTVLFQPNESRLTFGFFIERKGQPPLDVKVIFEAGGATLGIFFNIDGRIYGIPWSNGVSLDMPEDPAAPIRFQFRFKQIPESIREALRGHGLEDLTGLKAVDSKTKNPTGEIVGFYAEDSPAAESQPASSAVKPPQTSSLVKPKIDPELLMMPTASGQFIANPDKTRALAKFSAHRRWVWFSQNTGLLTAEGLPVFVSASNDNTVRFFSLDLKTGQTSELTRFSGHKGWV